MKMVNPEFFYPKLGQPRDKISQPRIFYARLGHHSIYMHIQCNPENFFDEIGQPRIFLPKIRSPQTKNWSTQNFLPKIRSPQRSNWSTQNFFMHIIVFVCIYSATLTTFSTKLVNPEFFSQN